MVVSGVIPGEEPLAERSGVLLDDCVGKELLGQDLGLGVGDQPRDHVPTVNIYDHDLCCIASCRPAKAERISTGPPGRITRRSSRAAAVKSGTWWMTVDSQAASTLVVVQGGVAGVSWQGVRMGAACAHCVGRLDGDFVDWIFTMWAQSARNPVPVNAEWVADVALGT
jgi:hypothetical protein